MYEQVKEIVKKLVPQEFLFKHELLFRRFLVPFYHGKNYTCNICEKSWKKFIELPDKDLLCPYCSSRSRTRRLFQILKNEKLNGEVLHFSPSRSLYRKLKNQKHLKYYSSDFENEFLADYHFDITDIDAKAATFDFIICYHILEHINDDEKAMQELFRVLKNDGKCFVQTPFKAGDIYENENIVSKEDRLKEFGQADHVRIYSVEGLRERLQKVGFIVKVLRFEEELSPFGLKQETVLELKK